MFYSFTDRLRMVMSLAEKEHLKLLATLPFEPEVVREGDIGAVDMLDNEELSMTREFNKMVDEITQLTDTHFFQDHSHTRKTA